MSVIDGRPLSNTDGRRARSDREPATPRSPPARRSAQLVFSTLVTASREPAWRSPTSIATRRRSTARVDPGVDASAGAVPPSRDRPERSAPVPGSRGPDPLLRPHAQARRRYTRSATDRGPPRSGPTGSPATCPIVLVRIDEPEDCGIRPPAPPRARVLAHEGPVGRSRHPQREGASYVAGPPDVARDPGPHEPVGARGRTGPEPSGKVFILRRGSPLRGDARCAPGGGPGRPPEPTRHAGRAARARPPGRVESAVPPPRRHGETRSRPHRSPRRAARARVLQRPGRLCRRRP